MDQRCGDGRFIGRRKILAIGCWKEFPNFEVLDAKIASALNKITREFPVQEEGQPRGAESPKGGSVPTRIR